MANAAVDAHGRRLPRLRSFCNRHSLSFAPRRRPGHAPMAAKMRAQERAPLWNDVRSYFSLGEWMRSSSSANQTSRLSRLSSRLNEPTIGIEPPLPTSAAGFSHSTSSARRAIRNAWVLIGNEMAGLPRGLTNSALTYGGRRAVTEARDASAIRSGFCLLTSRHVILALALAGRTVFVPSPV